MLRTASRIGKTQFLNIKIADKTKSFIYYYIYIIPIGPNKRNDNNAAYPRCKDKARR